MFGQGCAVPEGLDVGGLVVELADVEPEDDGEDAVAP
jgi:hypothetical protein